MTLPEYNKKLDKTIADLSVKYGGNIMAGVATNALTMIKKRVQETGTNAKGTKFPAYSTKPMLIGSSSFPTKAVGQKVFGSKEKRKSMEWRTLGEGEDAKRLAILQGGYKEWRALMGRQTGHVDFSVSNEMWNDINVISKQSDHAKGIAIIGAKKDSEKRKLEGNTKRKGDILDLSLSEINELKRDYNLEVLNIFKNNGL
mgnify:CR=1 FL=1